MWTLREFSLDQFFALPWLAVRSRFRFLSQRRLMAGLIWRPLLLRQQSSRAAFYPMGIAVDVSNLPQAGEDDAVDLRLTPEGTNESEDRDSRTGVGFRDSSKESVPLRDEIINHRNEGGLVQPRLNLNRLIVANSVS